MVKRLCLAWKRNKQNKDKGAEPTVACSLFAQKTPESKQKENIMKSKMFEKETFKKEVVENVKYLYRKTMDEALKVLAELTAMDSTYTRRHGK